MLSFFLKFTMFQPGGLGLVENLVFQSQVYSCILLRRRTTSSDKNFGWTQSDRGRALIELVISIVRQFLDGPFILIHIVAETDLGIDIITEQVNVGLILGSSI